MYPTSAGSLKETGIPPEFQVKREHQTTYAGGSVYLCPHPKCQTPPFFAQSPSGIYSHIRRKHLGLALACPYCADKVYWNSKGWNSHMSMKHRNAPHFGTALADEASLAQEMLRTTERRSALSASASKKRRVRKKPAQHPQKGTPPESSSPTSSSDESTVDSSPDSSSGDSSDTETAGASKSSKRQAKSKSPGSTLTGFPPDVKQEQELDPGLEDMPDLEEEPPAPFPPQWASTPAKKAPKGGPRLTPCDLGSSHAPKCFKQFSPFFLLLLQFLNCLSWLSFAPRRYSCSRIVTLFQNCIIGVRFRGSYPKGLLSAPATSLLHCPLFDQ